jgi:hypothetical protein
VLPAFRECLSKNANTITDYDDDDDDDNNNNNNNNMPDIVIRDNEKRTCMLIDVAIPGDRNVIQKRS